jgi:hypothetical protein
MPHIAEDDLELLVVIRAREPNSLHAQINRHLWSLPAVIAAKSTRGVPTADVEASTTLEQSSDQRSFLGEAVFMSALGP